MEVIMRVLLLIYSVIGLCYAEVMYEQTSVSEEARKEGYACNSSMEHVGLMKAGEVKNSIPGDCMEADCGDSGMIIIFGCSPQTDIIGTDCKILVDKSKPYPECCEEHYECNETVTGEVTIEDTTPVVTEIN